LRQNLCASPILAGSRFDNLKPYQPWSVGLFDGLPEDHSTIMNQDDRLDVQITPVGMLQ